MVVFIYNMCYNSKIMASLELPTTSQEPAEPLDDDSFATAVHAVADLLDSPLVQPDATAFEVFRVPFGRFGDNGTLAANMVWGTGRLSGRILYNPNEKEAKGRIHVSRQAVDESWKWENFNDRSTNSELVERLVADWPLAQASLRFRDENVTDEELYGELSQQFTQLAHRWSSDRSYNHERQNTESNGILRHHGTTIFASRTYQDGLRRLRVTVTEPVLPGNNLLKCRATVDQLGLVEVSAYQYNDERRRNTPIKILDKQRTLGMMLVLLNKLTDEKYPL